MTETITSLSNTNNFMKKKMHEFDIELLTLVS
jgi:hypothetical protein